MHISPKVLRLSLLRLFAEAAPEAGGALRRGPGNGVLRLIVLHGCSPAAARADGRV